MYAEICNMMIVGSHLVKGSEKDGIAWATSDKASRPNTSIQVSLRQRLYTYVFNRIASIINAAAAG